MLYFFSENVRMKQEQPKGAGYSFSQKRQQNGNTKAFLSGVARKKMSGQNRLNFFHFLIYVKERELRLPV